MDCCLILVINQGMALGTALPNIPPTVKQYTLSRDIHTVFNCMEPHRLQSTPSMHVRLCNVLHIKFDDKAQ
jgi:hypothetical protein